MRNRRENGETDDSNSDLNINQWTNANSTSVISETACKLGRHLNVTRSQRIRSAMFPETLVESEAESTASLNTNTKTALQKLSEPAQMLKHAMANLINYQDDADLATKAIPELIKLLKLIIS